MRIKEMSNEQLLKEFEYDTIESVKKTNSGRGTKTINARIEKLQKELLKRLNK